MVILFKFPLTFYLKVRPVDLVYISDIELLSLVRVHRLVLRIQDPSFVEKVGI